MYYTANYLRNLNQREAPKPLPIDAYVVKEIAFSLYGRYVLYFDKNKHIPENKAVPVVTATTFSTDVCSSVIYIFYFNIFLY